MCSKNLHPRNLTWNLKRSPWKRRFLLETIIFRFHVKFRGSILKRSQEEVVGNNKTPVLKLPPGLGWCILAKNPTVLVDTG